MSGVNCLPESAYQEFMNTKLQYGKTDGRMFYHFTQSFSPTEDITPLNGLPASVAVYCVIPYRLALHKRRMQNDKPKIYNTLW